MSLALHSAPVASMVSLLMILHITESNWHYICVTGGWNLQLLLICKQIWNAETNKYNLAISWSVFSAKSSTTICKHARADIHILLHRRRKRRGGKSLAKVSQPQSPCTGNGDYFSTCPVVPSGLILFLKLKVFPCAQCPYIQVLHVNDLTHNSWWQ